MATTDGYYNKAAYRWAEAHNTPRFWGNHFDQFFQLLPTGRLLEVGCGGGRDAQELIKQGYDYTGIDPAESLLNVAIENNPAGEFLQLAAEDIRFENEFDGFWAAASLLHVPKSKIKDVLEKINKALVLNGKGFISIKKQIGDESSERLVSDEDGTRFFAFWTAEEFSSVLESAGFRLVQDVQELPMSESTIWLIFLIEKIN